MKLDVCFTPGEIVPGELAGRTAVVVDVLRATSTIVEALASGARAIYPVASIEDALRLANTFGRDNALLAGERRRLPIEGFDLGNSPAEFSADRVGGKTLVMTTTNGTVVLTQAAAADRVLVASLLNLSAVVEDLVRSEADPVILCSGSERQFALEDAVCAGLLAMRMVVARPGEWTMSDGAAAAIALAQQFDSMGDLLAMTTAAREIEAAGLGDDVRFCAEIDRHPILPIFQDRNITLATAPAAP